MEQAKTSFSSVLTAIRAAIVQKDYLNQSLNKEDVHRIHKDILKAYDRIVGHGLQVSFEKCTPKPGYLLVHCNDQESADWLKNIVPRLGPKEGSLMVLSGDDIPKPEGGLHSYEF